MGMVSATLLVQSVAGIQWRTRHNPTDPELFASRRRFGKTPVKPDPRAMFAAVLGTATAIPFFSFLLRVANCRGAGEGALWGMAFGIFFDSGLNASHSFFENRPFALFVLHRGYHCVSLVLVGAILGRLCGMA
ncbi:hypothetical protein FGB62_37g32 [Gracilaria domingensis]|nr:hypothetical protein FGB62_37g32 [Gracilaria domingensis]